jgi:2OG-Fe(II) oxygenase superfamily
MTAIAADLAALLAKVNRPGDFFTSGTTELLTPSLQVDGVGPIALPLLQVQAEQLIAVAEAAPYGRGQETLIDPSVRRTWQIAPDRVRIRGRHWQQTLEAIIARVAEGLGVDQPIDAELYKLLVYDRGSFFVGHRDTEKSPGMFATLVLVLPSLSSGGELLVRHAGREVRLDLRCEDPSEAAFAAFYADCVHEVLPVTDGCRLTLVYNLLRRDRGRKLEPPSYDAETARLAALLRTWGDGKTMPTGAEPSDDDAPEKLVYPLEHAYTQAELSFAALKGADAAVAGVLAAAAPQADCELHLALLEVEESGMAEYSGDYRRGRGWRDSDDDDEFEASEVTERSVSLSEWRKPDGDTLALGPLPVEEEAELAPPDAFADLEPDEEHFQEATGNAGATFERTYRRAALVLWPFRRRLAVVCQAGLSATLPLLEDMLQRADGASGDQHVALRAEALELAGHMVEQWPASRWSRSEAGPGRAAHMLTLLTRLGAAPTIEAFVIRATVDGDYGRGDNEALLTALACLPPKRQSALLALIVEKCAPDAFGPCAALLANAVGQLPDIGAAAKRLVEAMPGDPAKVAAGLAWRRGSMEPGHVADLLSALVTTERTLAGRACTHILAWPQTYDLDRVLVPALRALKHIDAAIEPLRVACLAHLRARAAEPLAPPADWQRASQVSCKCEHCAALSKFLSDPRQPTWVLRAVEHDRGHVEGTIRASNADVDTKTDRKGRPYSLICTKNQASYERRAAQRKQDLQDIAQLDG